MLGRISIPRDDQGSMRHPGLTVDRHLDRGFDSLTLFVKVSREYTELYRTVYLVYLFRLERRGFYFDLNFLDNIGIERNVASLRNEGVTEET